MQTTAAPVLIAGCGDLGCELGRLLVGDGIVTAGLRRSGEPLPHGIATIAAGVTQPNTLQRLAALRPQILVYSVAADSGSDDSYRRHYVDGLRNVLAALQGTPLRHVFFVSSTRVVSVAMVSQPRPRTIGRTALPFRPMRRKIRCSITARRGR